MICADTFSLGAGGSSTIFEKTGISRNPFPQAPFSTNQSPELSLQNQAGIFLGLNGKISLPACPILLLKKVMLERSEEGVLHRSNSPFAGVIPDEQRLRILEDLEQEIACGSAA